MSKETCGELLLIEINFYLGALNVPVSYNYSENKLYIDASKKSVLSRKVHLYTASSTSWKIPAGTHINEKGEMNLLDIIKSNNIKVEYVNYNSYKSIFDKTINDVIKEFKNIKGTSIDPSDHTDDVENNVIETIIMIVSTKFVNL